MSLVAYVDESGTHDPTGISQGADIVGVFGYIATPEQWKALSAEWSTVLVSHGIKVFHASEIADRKNGLKNPSWPYRNWTDQQIDRFVSSLIEIAREGTYFSLGGSVTVQAFNELMPIELKTHPYHFRFRIFLGQVIDVVNNFLAPPLEPTDEVDFHFDQQIEMEAQARQIFSEVKLQRDLQQRLGSISFDSKVDLIPHQTADLLAYVMRQSASRKMRGDSSIKSGGWEQQLIKDQNVVMGYYDREALKDFLQANGLYDKP